ncbi:Protein BPS1 [Theobroma cacao]|nr:Protein BPS1 [Theobroma cacao]
MNFNQVFAETRSLPSRQHPLTSQIDENLSRLRASEAASTSASIGHKLNGLQDLHECVDMLLQLPLTQQALAQEQHLACVEDLLDGSLLLLDACSTAKDALLQSKECIQELHSILRRRRGAEMGLANEVCSLPPKDRHFDAGKNTLQGKTGFPLPSRLSPLVSQIDEHLNRLKASNATSTSSAISHKLNGLQDLYDSVDKLLQLPFSQLALVQEQHKEWVNELLDGSLRLLDLCSTAKDVVLQTKENAHEIQSVLRRRRSGELELVGEVKRARGGEVKHADLASLGHNNFNNNASNRQTS